MHRKSWLFCIWHDFNRKYIREEMRYGLESRCVGKFRLCSVQRSPIYVHMRHSRGSNLRRNVVEGLTLEAKLRLVFDTRSHIQVSF